ncbi:MAG: hypothetical protein PHX70_07775 [Clostridium sp.]|nr:hypothetical protein [Clostridium sp.]
METLVYELKHTKVLSRNDIATIKNYIEKKYASYTEHEKAVILTKTVHQILDKNIEGLNSNAKNAVKRNLLKRFLSKDGQPVFLIDIFNLYMSDEDKPKDYSHILLNWINLHVENKISIDELKVLGINIPSSDKTVPSPNLANEDTILETKTYFSLNYIIQNIKGVSNSVAFLALIVYILIFIVLFPFERNLSKELSFKNINANVYSNTSTNTVANSYGIPKFFKYQNINSGKLRDFLNKRNSILADEPYFSSILSSAKKYNVNPILLFAITGQEQSFVPKQNKNSKKIANNPFNIYYSWQKYNTNITDSSNIACVTINNLSKNRPKNYEPFKWLNRKYAEDPNWSKGVEFFYNELEKNIN